MPDEIHDPVWFSLAMAFIGSLPATLSALAALIYAVKVNTKVDGIITKSIDAVKDMATPNVGPRSARKTDP